MSDIYVTLRGSVLVSFLLFFLGFLPLFSSYGFLFFYGWKVCLFALVLIIFMHNFIIPMLSWSLLSFAGSMTVLSTVGGPLAKYGGMDKDKRSKREGEEARRGSSRGGVAEPLRGSVEPRCGQTFEKFDRTSKAVSTKFSACLQEGSNQESSTKQGSGRFDRTYPEFGRTYPESDRTYTEFGRTFSHFSWLFAELPKQFCKGYK